MSVITRYLNDNAQAPLGRFVVYMLYKELCSKYDEKSNRWSLSLDNSSLSSRTMLIKNWGDLEGKGSPKVSETSPFDRSHMTSYSTSIETMRLSCAVFEL